jgi:hypothetical protein
VQADEVHIGDIIRYRQGDTFIIHHWSIMDRRGGTTFITKGDANNAQAPSVSRKLDGKVILVIPRLGWLSIGYATAERLRMVRTGWNESGQQSENAGQDTCHSALVGSPSRPC